MNGSKIEVRSISYRTAVHNLTTQKLRPLLKSLRPHCRRRIAGKRTVEEDAHVHAKKERTECTDLSLTCPLPEASQSASIGTATATTRKKTS